MIEIQVNEDTLVDSLDKQSARKLIMAIDAAQQCSHFTVNIIKELIDVLECDMESGQIAKELGFIEKEL